MTGKPPTAADTARARESLGQALRGALTRGVGVPCLEPTRGPRWTSEDPDDLADAAAACGPCPARALCWEAGRREPWGVWGGVARGLTPAARLPVQHATLLALATAPRPLTVDETAADVADVLGESVARHRVADALARSTRRGESTRHDTDPRTYTVTPEGEAAAAEWLDAETAGGNGVRALNRDRAPDPPAGVTDT